MMQAPIAPSLLMGWTSAGRLLHKFAACALLSIMPTLSPLAAELDTTKIDRLVEKQVRWSRLPGVALVVVRPDQEFHAAAFSSNGSTLSPDTPFLIGSVTKTFTALAIAQLADAGKLQFDDPVVAHLPQFTLDAPDGGRTITLRHLLTHTSGLRQWSGHDRLAQREAQFDHISPARPPGIKFEYSSLNYIILGQVVEAVSGETYGHYVQRQIFEPLEMTNSFVDLEAARERGLVQGHWYLFGLSIPGHESTQPAPLVPAGFLISSARDLGNYLGMLLNEGQFRGKQVVSSETLREMFKPWDDAAVGPGMGWGIGKTRIGHAGNTPTFSARLALLPKERYGVVVLANVNSGPFFAGTSAVMDGVIQALRGEPVEPVLPYEILLKLGILILVLTGLLRTFFRFRHWSQSGFPRRLIATRPVLMPLAMEAAAIAVIVIVVPRWLGVPLLTILEYFPDLGLAILVGVVTGASAALMQSFVRASATPQHSGYRLAE